MMSTGAIITCLSLGRPVHCFSRTKMKGVKPHHFQMNRISCFSCFYVLLDFCLELYKSANIYIYIYIYILYNYSPKGR